MLSKYKNIRNSLYDLWERLYLFALVCIYILYMLSPAQLPFWNYGHAICNRLYILVLLSYFLFRGFRAGREALLMLALCLWILVSRFLNAKGGEVSDLWLVRENLICFLFLPGAMICSAGKRRKMMDLFAVISGVYFSIVAAVGVFAAVRQTLVRCPWSDTMMIAEFSGKMGRLSVFGCNPNTVSLWFFLGIFFLAYLFCRSKWLWRIPIIIGALINYFALTLTYSRNSMLAFALCFALLTVLMALRLLRGRKPAVKALAAVLLICVFAPLSYLSFNLSSDVLALISSEAVSQRAEVTVIEDAASPMSMHGFDFRAAPLSAGSIEKGKGAAYSAAQDSKPTFSDKRGLEDSGRIPIYKSGILTLKKDPIRLIRGCAFGDKMDIAHTVLSKPYDSFHSSYLQLLVVTGIPGFLLALAFLLSVAMKAAALFFSEDSGADFSAKVLTLPLVGIVSYNALESAIFFDTSVRTLSFFLLAGAAVAVWDGIAGKKNNQAET